MEIRYAQNSDIEWLCKFDKYITEDWVRRCVNMNEYLVAIKDDRLAGFVRFSMFWGSIPYLDVIYVPESGRRLGVGTDLINFWQDEMKKLGAETVMSSVVVHKLDALEWHEQHGFTRCGQLVLGKRDDSPEVFFRKHLS